MNKYYVATLSRYVIVDATDEATAREAGREALAELYSEGDQINILTIRLATDAEVDICNTHQENVAREAAR